MAKNNFKPFATGAGANVPSQADWEALTALLTGFQSGKAASAQVNKALRQGTVMASVIGQFIADSTGQDVLDNGNTSVLLTNFLNALKTNTYGRLLNVRTERTRQQWVRRKSGFASWAAAGLEVGLPLQPLPGH